MGIQSNITQLFTCDAPGCLRTAREHVVRHRKQDWPEPVLPAGWIDLGELGIICPACRAKLNQKRLFARG